MKKTIFFLGAGNMAESIIEALLRNQVFEPYDVIVYDISEARMDHMIWQCVRRICRRCAGSKTR